MEGFVDINTATCRINESDLEEVEACCTTTTTTPTTTTGNCCSSTRLTSTDNASNMSEGSSNIGEENKKPQLHTSEAATQQIAAACGKEVTGLTHECGVFGAIACGDWPTQIDIAHVTCLGLVALQHRGQESAGIVTSEGKCSKNFNVHKGMGMISNLFNEDSMKKLKGNLGIGHTRYSTSGGSEVVNCQPFVVHTAYGAMALAHNGELVNSESLRREVLGRGVGLSTHSDSELIAQSLCNCPEGISEVDGPNWPAL